jgi:hypothetical protein
MKIRTRNSKDLYAGLIFFLFGISSVLISRNYPMGTAARMGAGYFPSILGGILAIIGVGIAMRGLWFKVEAVRPFALRPLFLVLGAVLAFALLLESLGLVAATLALIVISCLGGREFRLREVVVLFLLLTALAVGVFVYGLGIPFKVWPI